MLQEREWGMPDWVCVGGVQFAVLRRVPEEVSLGRGPVGQGRELVVRLSGGKASGGGQGRCQGPEVRPGG